MNFHDLVHQLRDPGLTRVDGEGERYFIPLDPQAPIIVRHSQTKKTFLVTKLIIEDHGEESILSHTVWLEVDDF